MGLGRLVFGAACWAQASAGFKIPHNDRFDFKAEQQQLLAVLEAAFKAREAHDWQPHCMFGKMTSKEWGKLLQIHADYHLRQFAA